MSWQDVQWNDLQFEAASLDLPDPEPITLRPLPPLADKNDYIRHHLQLRLASTCSALCFITGMILLISAGTNQVMKIIALIFGIFWLLLLLIFFLIKASMDRKEQEYKKAERKWLDWERRAYMAGLPPQQRKLFDSLLNGEKPVVHEELSSAKGRTKRELSVRVQPQEGE